MRIRHRTLLFALLLSLIGISAAEAQVFTPTYMAPRASSDVGVYLSDGPGEFAVEGIWRRASGGFDLGLRGGVADTDDPSVLVGAEIRNPLALGAPLDLAVTGAVQGILGDFSAFGALVGLTAGHTFGADDFAFTPYLHPRIGIVDGPFDDDAELELLADFGLDLRLSPRLDLRFGIGIDSEAADWGVGFAWR